MWDPTYEELCKAIREGLNSMRSTGAAPGRVVIADRYKEAICKEVGKYMTVPYIDSVEGIPLEFANLSDHINFIIETSPKAYEAEE